jgi:hypothetical protein
VLYPFGIFMYKIHWFMSWESFFDLSDKFWN